MKKIKNFGTVLFFAVILIACNKDIMEKEPNVFVVGCEYDRHASIMVPKLWKNGVAQNLSDSESKTANAHSVYVSGNDVYVAGIEGGWSAILWKNGVAQTTPTLVANSLCSVFTSKNDVYLAGDNLLKNGVVQNLSYSENTVRISTNSVYVVGNDVYVAGYETRFNEGQYYYCATLWKNGVPQYLTEESIEQVTAKSVFVSGKDVYVAGCDYVDYTNIYGTFSKSVAKLWKNGVAQNLTNGNENGFDAMANSVYVYGRDVFVAGYERSGAHGEFVAKLWKNGVEQNLTDGSSFALAMSVFVK